MAETLTGWTQEEATGVPLEKVFKTVNEETRRKVENAATRALREGSSSIQETTHYSSPKTARSGPSPTVPPPSATPKKKSPATFWSFETRAGKL